MNYPDVVGIIEKTKETKDVATIKFNCVKKTKPGQFFMIWIPGIDEIPMSVSYISEKIKGFTFRIVGEATKELFKLKKGDKIGIRGPLGNGFDIKGKHLLFIGGGTGIAMLAPAIENESKSKKNITVILGVKTKDELFFYNRINKTNANIIIYTNDGSKGLKGIATDKVVELIKKENFNQIITCGPELMMKKIMDLTQNISFQASLERYMKCGMGLCGQCTVGDGLRVCIEGPIFNRSELEEIKDFGKYKRDECGKKLNF